MGALLYAAIQAIALRILHTVPSWYATQTFRPDLLWDSPRLILSKTLEQMGIVYLGGRTIFLGQGIYYELLIFASLVMLLARLYGVSRASKAMAFLILAGVIAILIAPFLLHPFSGGQLPYRTLIAVPAALSSTALLAAEGGPRRACLFVLLPLAMLALFEFSWIANKKYYAGHWSLERDKEIAWEIISRIRRAEPEQTTFRIAVVGSRPRKYGLIVPDPRGEPWFPSSTLGASFFGFYGWLSSQYRVAHFFNYLSDVEFRPPDTIQLATAFQAAANMPSFPAEGSVAKVGNVFVIKFSPAGQPEFEYEKRRLSLDLNLYPQN